MNMSCCRFENTASDLDDCLDHIEDDLSGASEHERRARITLIETCRQIAADFEDVDDLEESFAE